MGEEEEGSETKPSTAKAGGGEDEADEIEVGGEGLDHGSSLLSAQPAVLWDCNTMRPPPPILTGDVQQPSPLPPSLPVLPRQDCFPVCVV